MNGGAAAAAAAAVAKAIKASGTIVRMEPEDFKQLLARMKAPVIVHATGGMFKTNYRYLTSYKGLAFYTKSPEQLLLPGDAEVINAKRIWVPEQV